MNRLPREWVVAVAQMLEREAAVVRIVVAEVRGSAPREAGAFMLVGRGGVEGTIGGGRLEWESIAAARELLDDTSAAARLSKVVLGADLGQCCGGVVSVWLERFTREDVGLLRLAGDAGARCPAVLSSTIKGTLVERQLVEGPGAAEMTRVERQLVGGGGRGETRGTAGRVGVTAGVAAGAGLGGADGSACADGAGQGAGGGTGRDASGGTSGSAGVDMGDGAGGSSGGRRAEELLSAPRRVARPVVVRDDEGRVTFLERLDDEFPTLWLYGAGHVGQALARILAELPLRLTWVDSRAELFPAVLPEGVRVRRDVDSLATVADAPRGAYFLVMTHSHPLDFALCQTILSRNDFAWLGLIGSASKAARFRSRLSRARVDAATIGRLVCPIGVEGIESKWPAAIAVAVAAQVMQQLSAAPERDVQSPAVPRRVGASSVDHALSARVDAADCGAENCATCGTAGRDAVPGVRSGEGAGQGEADASAKAGRVTPS
jgi:xanthine dehydrogenase accessory factor